MRRVSPARHHVARLQLVDEALTGGVAQQGAVPAQRFGEERSGHGVDGEGGGVELGELDVGHRHPRAQRHGDAVAGGLDRIGGDGVELAGAAGGHQHVGGPHLTAPSRRRSGR
jgi:hypothetical protein